MSGAVFLTVEQVETLHRLALEQRGGQDGVRDLAAFHSAVTHPQNVWFYAQGEPDWNHGDHDGIRGPMPVAIDRPRPDHAARQRTRGELCPPDRLQGIDRQSTDIILKSTDEPERVLDL